MSNKNNTRKVRLTEDEYRIIKMYRRMKKERKSHRKNVNTMNTMNFSNSLQREIRRQNNNLRKILSNKRLGRNHKKSVRRIVRTEKENGKFYKVVEEDHGSGLKEVSRELLPTNLENLYSDMHQSSMSSNYRRREYIKNINGEGYKIVEEDKGDGQGFVKVYQQKI
jgi:hypothetical protein